MAKILCHSVRQKAQLFKVIPTRKDVEEEFVIYLENCVICNNPVLEIIRLDIWGKLLAPVRIRTKNIDKFINSMSVIWKPEKIACIQSGISGFILGYNEFGVKKNCAQNLCNVKLGKIETDPYIGLKSYTNSKAKETLKKVVV